MRHRAFLLALVAILLLMQAVLRSAAQATPFTGGSTIGGFTFWELRGAIPLGIYAAGILLTSSAAAVMSMGAAWRLFRGSNRISTISIPLSAALLWCGIPTVASCFKALPCIFSWLGCYDPTGWQTLQNLEWALYGGMGLLITCHATSCSSMRSAATFTLCAAFFCILAIGQFGYAQAFILIPAAVLGAAGGLMLQGKGKRWAAIPLLTAVMMNAIITWQHAAPVACIPAAIVVYLITILMLALPLYLKAATPRS